MRLVLEWMRGREGLHKWGEGIWNWEFVIRATVVYSTRNVGGFVIEILRKSLVRPQKSGVKKMRNRRRKRKTDEVKPG